MIALELLHGRPDPDEHLTSWGTDGPVFLVRWVHVSYLLDLRLGLDDETVEGVLPVVGASLVYYDGVYYGDWNVLPATDVLRYSDYAARVVPFDPGKAVIHQ